MLKKFLFSHDEGATIDLIQILFGILALAFILLINISLSSTTVKRSNIDLVVHEYIMRMETEGCLTDDAEEQLRKTLTDMGMQDIVITGTISPVNYGDRIMLTVQGDLINTAYHMSSNVFALVKGQTSIPVSISKTSVSRYVR